MQLAFSGKNAADVSEKGVDQGDCILLTIFSARCYGVRMLGSSTRCAGVIPSPKRAAVDNHQCYTDDETNFPSASFVSNT